MPVYSPKFTGIWVQVTENEIIVESAPTIKFNKNTGSYLKRFFSNVSTYFGYNKVSDSDSSSVNGDEFAIEDLNLPAGGRHWEKRLLYAEVFYDPVTGIATCNKTMIEDEQIKTKLRDLPVNRSQPRIV